MAKWKLSVGKIQPHEKGKQKVRTSQKAHIKMLILKRGVKNFINT